MTALARVCLIVHLSTCLPMRWLAGIYNKLGSHDWSVRSMRKVVDILEKSLDKVQSDGSYIINEEFMMGCFSELYKTIPPLKAYLNYMFKEKNMLPVKDNRKLKKVVHLKR